MEIVRLIVSLLITGTIFGALGRLAVPGPNPMSMGSTILAGIAGSFLGTLVALLIGLEPVGGELVVYFVLQILGAALIVYALSRRARRI